MGHIIIIIIIIIIIVLCCIILFPYSCICNYVCSSTTVPHGQSEFQFSSISKV